MNIKNFFLLLLSILLVSGCASVKVKTDFDADYDFNTFKSYRWASEDEVNPNDVLARNTLVRNRFVTAIDREMQQKGFTKVTSGDADLVIVMHAGTKERMQVSQSYTGPGPGPVGYRGRTSYYWYDPWWGPYGGTTNVSYYTEGTLVIDMVSWETKELTWRGTGTRTVGEHKNAEKQQQAIDKAVAKILADFPPK